MSRATSILLVLAPVLASGGPLLAQEAGSRPAGAERPAPSPTPAPAPARDPAAERAAGREALLAAYRKEYAFLASEESALRERLGEVAAERARREAAARDELAGLEERLRDLKQELEQERKRAQEQEQLLASLDDGADAVEAVIAQAGTIGGTTGGERDPADAAARLQALRGALEASRARLREQSRLRRVEGGFFLPDGKQTRGTLLHVGAIGALGASPAGAGTLAPAGRGALQLWSDQGAPLARQATSGPLPAELPLYLFESLEQAVDRPREASLLDTLTRGGTIAWVIAVLGACAVLLLALRALSLLGVATDAEQLLGRVTPLLQAGRDREAGELVARDRSAAGRVLAAVIPHVAPGGAQLESAASERMLQEALRIDRFDAAIMVTAAVAPLLGLLGTVTGMIGTFDVITVYGTGDPKLLAGGISEALITTELGLTVAIPTVLLGQLLGGWAERIRSGMERAALRLAVVSEERAARQARQSNVEDDDRLPVGVGQ